jgi:hypothetical protein
MSKLLGKRVEIEDDLSDLEVILTVKDCGLTII